MGGSRLEVRVAKRARDGKGALHPPAACIDHMAARRLHLSPRRGTAMVSGSRGLSGSGPQLTSAEGMKLNSTTGRMPSFIKDFSWQKRPGSEAAVA